MNDPITTLEAEVEKWRDLALSLPHMVASNAMKFKRAAMQNNDKLNSSVQTAIARAFEGQAREMQAIVEGAMEDTPEDEETDDVTNEQD